MPTSFRELRAEGESRAPPTQLAGSCCRYEPSKRQLLPVSWASYSADQPPSDARMAPLTLVPSSLSRKVIEAASCAAVAGVGMFAPISGPSRSAASWEPHSATMLVIVAPGATALKRRPFGPYITVEFLVRPTTACFDAV